MINYRKYLLTITFAVRLIIFNSCSNPKAQYEELQNKQSEVKEFLYQSDDSNKKIKLCDELLQSINSFLDDFPESNYSYSARSDKILWTAVRDSLRDVASSKRDYEELLKLQTSSEKVLKESKDFAIKMKACDDMIVALQRFLDTHQRSIWNSTVTTSLLEWQSRKLSLELELTNLYSRLYDELKSGAVAQSKRKHPLSKVEEIILISRLPRTEGSIVCVMDVYIIKIRGILLGRDVFNFSVIVKGELNLETKEISLNETKVVE